MVGELLDQAQAPPALGGERRMSGLLPGRLWLELPRFMTIWILLVRVVLLRLVLLVCGIAKRASGGKAGARVGDFDTASLAIEICGDLVLPAGRARRLSPRVPDLPDIIRNPMRPAVLDGVRTPR